MTSKGIFYSTRALGGREGGAIMHHIKSIMSKSCVIDGLTNGTTDAMSRALYNFNGMRLRNVIGEVSHFYHTKGIHMSNWMEFYDALDVSGFEQYDDLDLVGGVDLWRSGLTRNGKRAG